MTKTPNVCPNLETLKTTTEIRCIENFWDLIKGEVNKYRLLANNLDQLNLEYFIADQKIVDLKMHAEICRYDQKIYQL